MKTLRIAFIHSWNHALSWFFYSQGVSTPPYGMCRAASLLTKQEHEVVVFDAHMLKEDAQAIALRVHDWRADIVVIGAFPELHLHTFMGVSAFPYDVEYCQTVRDALPECTILLGGYIPSSFRDKTLRLALAIDGIVYSQSDLQAWVDRCTGSPKQVVHFDPEPSAVQGYSVLVPDIRDYGIDKHFYLDPPVKKVYPVLPILTATGCRHHCTFCATPEYFSGKYRTRPLDSVLNEIQDAVSQYSVTRWSVWDDTFTVEPSRVRAFCEGLLGRELAIEWWCFAHAKWVTRHPDLLGLMREAGCRMMWIGIESVDADRLGVYKKGNTTHEGLKAVELILQREILPTTSFLIGEPGEDQLSLERRIRASEYFQSLGSVNVYTLLIPVPGTELFRQLFDTNQISNRDLRLYSGARSVLKYKALKAEDLEEAFFSVYSRSILSARFMDASWGGADLWRAGDASDPSHEKELYMVRLAQLAKDEFRRMRNLENGPGAKVDACMFVR